MSLLWNNPPEVWQYIVCAMGWIFAFHLGYGNGRTWGHRFFVGCCYAIPLLAIGINLWMSVIPLVFITLFILSNRPKTAGTFPWKIVEFSTGFLIGLAVAYFVRSSEWLMIAAMALGGAGFAAGGTHIPKIGGQKWLRRFATPLTLTLILWMGLR